MSILRARTDELSSGLSLPSKLVWVLFLSEEYKWVQEIADIMFDTGVEMVSQVITIDGEEEHFPMYASERQAKEVCFRPIQAFGGYRGKQSVPRFVNLKRLIFAQKLKTQTSCQVLFSEERIELITRYLY